MGSPAIDLSAGLAPKTPPAGGIDLSAGLTATAAAPAPAAPAAPQSLTANPKSEGLYRMRGPAGAVGIPYSNVEAAKSQGYQFGDKSVLEPGSTNEEERYEKDKYYGSKLESAVGPLSTGALKSAIQIPNTLADWLDSAAGGMQRKAEARAAGEGHPAHYEREDLKPKLENAEEHIAPGINEPMRGAGEHIGGFAETLAEWLFGEGEAKATFQALPLSQRMTKLAQAAGFIEKHPAIAEAVSEGMRAKAVRLAARAGATGAGAAAQTAAHGGSPADAGEAALLGGGGTAAIDAAGLGVTGLVRRFAQPAVTADAATAAAKDVVANRLAETNATRGEIGPQNNGDYHFRIEGPPTRDTTKGSIAQQPQKVQVGHRVVEGKGPSERQVYPPPQAPETQVNFQDVNGGDPNAPGNHRSPTYRLTEDSKPGSVTKSDSAAGGGTLLTRDVKVASAHLGSVDRIIASPEFARMGPEEQTGYRAQRADIQQQIGDYYKHQKTAQGSAPVIGPPSQVQKVFKPINAQDALDAVGNPRDAGDLLRQHGAEVYEHANDVSGGQWQTLDKSIEGHINQLGDLSDIENNRSARAKLRSTIAQEQAKMFQILDDPKNGFDANDVTQAKKNFRAGYLLDDMHKAISPLFDGIEEQSGRATGQYRGVNGNMLGARFDEFLRAPENKDAVDILGRDRVDTLQKVFRANDTVASRRRFGNAVLSIATALGGYKLHGMGGAVGGELAYQGIRKVLNGMVQDPNVAKNILFAIDSGARPENYSPMIAKMIEDAQRAAHAAIPVGASAAVRSQEKQQ